MSEDAVVLSVIQRLESLGLEYMLVGSYASNVWGRPRSSYVADIVVRIAPSDADRFFRAFAGDYAVEAESLRKDIELGRMFNLIPTTGIFKIDIIPVRRGAYAQEEFSRRRSIRAFGHDLWVASPEDTILYKLVWYRDGGHLSGRQLEDARDVYSTQQGAIDDAYLDRWAAALDVADLLARARQG